MEYNKRKIGKNKKKVDNKIKSIQYNGSKVKDKTEIANIMNNFYCNIGKKLSKQITKPNEEPKEIENNSKSMFLKPTNADEVTKIIKELKNKAGGGDKINAMTLKIIAPYIALPLAYLCNLSLEKNVWPEALKSAEELQTDLTYFEYCKNF